MTTNAVTKLDELERGLTKKQIAFVDNLLRIGNKRGAKTMAAVQAGYAEGSADVQASRNLSNPKVQQYMHAKAMDAMSALVPEALGAIGHLIRDGKSELVKLQAAQDILDRSGFKPIEKSMVAMQGEFKVSIDLS